MTVQSTFLHLNSFLRRILKQIWPRQFTRVHSHHKSKILISIGSIFLSFFSAKRLRSWYNCHRRCVVAICNIVFPQWLTETIKYIKATILKVKVDFLRHLRSCLGVLRKWLLGIDIQCFQSNEIFYCSFHFQTTCLGSNNSTGILV